MTADPGAVPQTPGADPIDDCLRCRFGLEAFREGQREVIETVLRGRSALVVMPTGGGKSLCYQLPALLSDGLTLVVSPLIALMKDQVDSLIDLGLPATFVNSTLDWSEQRRRLDQVAAGRIKLLFVAPERFRNDGFWQALQQTQVGLLAVDEAHCISQWGHDFRPDYLALGEVRKSLGEPVTLALTATATPTVRDDIRHQLGLDNARVFVSGFERENLFLEVYRAGSNRDKTSRLEASLDVAAGSAIVYCTTRRVVEEVSARLARTYPKVGYYHGGMKDADRDQIQDDFMDGEIDILVATNAFGMGVDKPDIRAIVHYQFPASLEAYYQEAGRAGRDSKPAHCLLLYNYADRRIPDFFIENTYPEQGVVQSVWQAVSTAAPMGEPLADWMVEQRLPRGVHRFSIDSALKLLEKAGHLRLERRPGEQLVRALDQARVNQLRIDWVEQAKRRQYEEDRLQRMIYYAAGKKCRTGDIIRYFGGHSGQRGCGHCDNCAGGSPHSGSVRVTRTRLDTGAVSDFSPIVTADDPQTLARKVAACVARCKQRESARVVAQILTGSRSQKLRRRDLHRLSTYGILGQQTRRQVERLIDVLLGVGFLEAARGNLRLTTTAIAVMKGDEPLSKPIEAAVGELLAGGKAVTIRKDKAVDGLSDTVAASIQMLRDGHPPRQVAEARKLKRRTVLGHLLKAAEARQIEGIDLGPLDGALLPVIRSVADEVDWRQSLKALRAGVMAAYPGVKPAYDKLILHLAYLLQKGELG